MNLRQLEFFKMLADTEHMTQAAKLLNTTQPNLSHAMSELEKELEAQLFEKIGRNIQLTKYGKFFYKYVNTALSELSKGERALKDLVSPDKGLIDFGFIYTAGSFLAPMLLKEFSAREGNSQIRFNLFQGNSSDMMDLLLREEVDLAITSKLKEDKQLHYDILTEDEVVLIVPPNHPLAQYDQISLKETAGYPFVYFNKRSGLRPYIDKILSTSNVEPEIVCEVEEDHSMLGFVAHGFGIALMPSIPSISSYQVKAIRLIDNSQPRYIYLATKKEHFLSPAAIRFKEFILLFTQGYFNDFEH
ncbi:LysR family transcriptional regulator [Enterococcus sp. BWB1-3]|uniref:LysR family transcriptional regulator n=1 Tax=unclassified Enterococcus TaxID=2608891 RepID=UPI001922A908|nr:MULTISPECIES: LysR family transcriptional regulator [unclassified Enterococcus]MBL1229125.1 LysR family transcriptional regulator [Enterococcus sp. BWB1-3]MCB5952505.1 LysR family transcriptional regulator [Enterococcus sp. BWT-B8]MCB5953454.1 LysR family transcriptional regulator [Enterococcus sp. CWB-B31]